MDNKFEENVSAESMISNDSDTEMPKESEFDLELEKLFKEMDTQLELIRELESLDANYTVNNGSETKNGAAFCLDGISEHDLVLDEEIRWICTVCHIVTLEINNILIPDFGQSSRNLADKVQAEKI